MCDELVDAVDVGEHMDGHGLITPDKWRLRTWPDGVVVLINPWTGGPA